MEKTELYRHFDGDGRLLYVGISSCAVARTYAHRKSSWFGSVSTITVERFGSREMAGLAEKRAIEDEKPMFNTHYASGYRDLRKKTTHLPIPKTSRFKSSELTKAQLAEITRIWENSRLSESTRLIRIEEYLGKPMAKAQAYYICVTKPKRKAAQSTDT